jgi:quinol monooxygenase YgiN
MNEAIYWILEVAILPGQFENFRAVARDLITSAQSEPGTLSYEWNLNADGTACHIYERYRDSAAVRIHVQGFGPFAERFMQACRPTHFNVYGSPNEDVKAALADFYPTYYTNLLGGFSR